MQLSKGQCGSSNRIRHSQVRKYGQGMYSRTMPSAPSTLLGLVAKCGGAISLECVFLVSLHPFSLLFFRSDLLCYSGSTLQWSSPYPSSLPDDSVCASHATLSTIKQQAISKSSSVPSKMWARFVAGLLTLPFRSKNCGF